MNKLFYVLAMSLLSFLMGACGTPEGVENMGVEAFSKAIASDKVQLVDVRTAEEFAEGHIEKAQNIDVTSGNFMQKATSSLDKSHPVYVYCRTGGRSMQAATMLAKQGFQVKNLDTGIVGWVGAGKPVTTKLVKQHERDVIFDLTV
ncbi:Thiosulfate sulfurtransferase GlpE [Porphyromonas levii]|nr:Thiosulfate sulfurtransferase GlpE [Porphyromonas levii]